MLKGFIVLTVLASFSAAVQSNDSYQFFGGGVSSFEDYDDGSNGRYKSFFAGAYLDPIRLNGDLPIDEAAFWQRTSSIALGYGQYERAGMNEVRGGRILKHKESTGGSLSIHLAHQSIPLWLAWREYYFGSSDLVFLGEGENNSLTTEAKYSREFTAGLYLNDLISVDISYYRDKPLEIYSLVFNLLQKMDHNRSLGFYIGIEKADDERINLDVKDGVVRNLDSSNSGWTAYSIQGSYYPSKYLSAWAGISQQDISELDVYLRRFIVGGAINLKSGIRVALSSTRIVQENYFIWPEQDSTHYNLSLAYRF